MTKNWYQVKYIPECFIFFKSKTLPNRNQKGKTLSNFAKICQTRDCHWRPKRRTRVNFCHQIQCYRWALSQLSPEKKTQALGEIRNHTHHIRHFRSLKENKITGADVLKNNSIKIEHLSIPNISITCISSPWEVGLQRKERPCPMKSTPGRRLLLGLPKEELQEGVAGVQRLPACPTGTELHQDGGNARGCNPDGGVGGGDDPVSGCLVSRLHNWWPFPVQTLKPTK